MFVAVLIQRKCKILWLSSVCDDQIHTRPSTTSPLKHLFCVQTAEEFQVLQGAMINVQIAKRGKTVASRKLRNNAKKFDGMVIDYRQMGYVTEVKDQVRPGS